MLLQYKKIDGMHTFTSLSKYGLGLLVMHQDINLCFEEIKLQLRTLLKENHKTDVTISICLSPEQFLAVGIKMLNVQVLNIRGEIIA